jgi:ubiquinone/menaquinone biosynthesis C-methylase UbiE
MKILELGCGDLPAYQRGGSVFETADVEYTGVDIELSEWLEERPGIQFVEANISSMPFLENESFDLALMRSFFGQFCDGTTTEDPFIRPGIREIHRVLKHQGHLAVVEENTPMDSEDVLHELEQVGFRKLELEEMAYGRDNFGTENPWRSLRSRYYNDIPIQAYPDEWLGDPYVLLVAKQ